MWLRGPRLDETTRGVLRAVLGCTVYLPLGDGQLKPDGKSVPHGHEPQGSWLLLRDWLVTALPPQRFAMREVNRVSLSLVRSGTVQPTELLCLARGDWLAYAATAPQARLDRLTFATCDGQTAVLGKPLPPIRGVGYWMQSGVAAPVGMTWSPAVNANVLRDVLQLQEGDIALLEPDGEYCVIRSDQFVGASRSAARLTEEAGRAEA